jgi:hypothetical protein
MYIGPALQGASMISRVGVPLLQSAALAGGMAGLEALASRLGQKKPNTSERPKGTQATRGGKPVYWTGSDYGWQSGPTAARRGLLGTEVVGDEAFARVPQTPPSAPSLSSAEPPGYPGAAAAAERSYQGEKARALQLSAQDPLFKKYQIADLTKAYNSAKTTEEKEKLGLQIWATTNPQLAQKLKPGQLGYTEATTAFQAMSPLGTFTQAKGGMEFANKLPEMEANAASFSLETPLTGIQIPPTTQIGVAEQFKNATPIPGGTEVFTDPLKFFAPQDIGQTKRALIKKAFEERLK